MEDNVKEILLQRSETLGFGFSIIGGTGSDLPPVICDIVENSPADHCENLEAGDVILAVNDLRVNSCSTKEVLNCLRLSGSNLKLKLREDPAVRRKADRYLSCSPEDIETLRDAISQGDLTGVDELIVKRHGSPRQATKHRCRHPDDRPIVTRSPKMPLKMERENVNGQSGIAHSPSGSHKGGYHHQGIARPCQENGLDLTGKVAADGSQSNRSERRFETFVMTGDMIIRTSAPPPKVASKQKSRSKTDKESNVQNDQSVSSKPHESPKKKASRIPKPATPKNSPRHRPKGTQPVPPAESPQRAKVTHPEPPHTDTNCDAVVTVRDVVVVDREDNISSERCPQFVSDDQYIVPPPIQYQISAPILDIPPDDISSEDEKYRLDGYLNLDDLPPPPDELLQDFEVKETDSQTCYSGTESMNSCRIPEQIPTQDQSFSEQFVPVSTELPTCQSHDENETSLPCLLPELHIQEERQELEEEDLSDISDLPVLHIKEDESAGRDSDNSMHTLSPEQSPPRNGIVTSESAEKIAFTQSAKPNIGFRTSKSHENYLECQRDGLTLVDIDFGDNIASSVDALHYEKSTSSLDSIGNNNNLQVISRSLDNSPERRQDDPATRLHMPTFISVEEPRSIGKLKEGGRLREHDQPLATSKPRSQSTSSDEYRNEIVVGNEQLEPSVDTAPSKSTSDQSGECVQTDSQEYHSPEKHAEMMDYVCADANTNSSNQNSDVDNMQNVKSECVVERVSSSIVVEAPTRIDDESLNVPPPVVTHHIPHGASIHIPMEPQYAESEASTSGPSSPENGELDIDSIYHQPTKEADRASAARLAKRLFNLDGFKKGDISKHLSKKNDFAQVVGEEYLKYYDFTGETLDGSLRKFLCNITLAGETQERERVLVHFSRRFVECNPGTFNSEDACHTLTCAIMLLNTDLHGQNIGRKMTMPEFIENLADLNDGDNFAKEMLRVLYQSIKSDPLECEFEEEYDDYGESLAVAAQRGLPQEPQKYLGFNPFLDIPDPAKATEYKKGYVMRKCCVDQDGRRTPVGRRGWKMFYATLRDMVLYLHKDEHGFKKNAVYDNMSNAIRIHHSLATKATDYKKKQHVFRLKTADWAEYLFQTSDVKECQEWIDSINFVSASLSAPPLPGGVGSQKKFQRPLIPSSFTKLNMREQVQHHEQRVVHIEEELVEHRKYPPEKGAKSRVIHDYCEKETYLMFELKRFKTYHFLLQTKMMAFRELEPSLAEYAIGEVDEPPSPPSTTVDTALPRLPKNSQQTALPSSPQKERRPQLVQRSMSDRTSLYYGRLDTSIVAHRYQGLGLDIGTPV